MSDLLWDSELIRRYQGTALSVADCPVPRPMDRRIGSFELLHALRECRQQVRPLSLHLHLPFCTNACRHCRRVRSHGCDPQQLQDYCALLEVEIERLACHLDPRQRVEQLSFSGGSPFLLGEPGLKRLVHCLQRHFTFSDRAIRDFCIELDPRAADWSSMGMLLELGFNRINLRVDDLDTGVQAAIERPLSLASARTLIEAAHTLLFRSAGIELTRSLPGQTADSFEQTLARVIELQPDRVALPEYRPLPGHAPAHPDAEERVEILRRSVEQLQRAGYRYIGLDLFTLPDDDFAAAQEEGLLQLNPHGFALHASDLIGLGVSAVSHINGLYSQNHEAVEEYQRSLDNGQLPTARGIFCDVEERLQQTLRQQLICDRQLSFSALEQRFGLNIRQRFRDIWPQLQGMAADGLLALSNDHLRLLPRGVLLTNPLCRLLRSSPAGTPVSLPTQHVGAQR